jgi:sporulation protein YlmC with PRC-barrel domain
MDDRGHRISYQALRRGTEVFSSEGKRLGVVQRVVADTRTNIFKDLVIDTKLGPGGLKIVDPADIEDILEKAVVLKLSAAEVDQLPAP